MARASCHKRPDEARPVPRRVAGPRTAHASRLSQIPPAAETAPSGSCLLNAPPRSRIIQEAPSYGRGANMPIDQAAYERWWPLHIRVARGESLSAEDEAYYHAVRRELEREETLGDPSPELRDARAAVASLEAERAALEGRRQQLQAEIDALEAALRRRTRQLLGSEG